MVDSLTRVEFKDIVSDRFNTIWEADVAEICGYTPDLYWPKKEEPEEKDVRKVFGRVVIRHVGGSQATFGEKRYYGRPGLFICQVFTPVFDRKGTGIDDQIANVVLGVMEGNWGGTQIFWRNPTAEEIGQSESWFQTNVSGEFYYQQLR